MSVVDAISNYIEKVEDRLAGQACEADDKELVEQITAVFEGKIPDIHSGLDCAVPRFYPEESPVDWRKDLKTLKGKLELYREQRMEESLDANGKVMQIQQPSSAEKQGGCESHAPEEEARRPSWGAGLRGLLGTTVVTYLLNKIFGAWDFVLPQFATHPLELCAWSLSTAAVGLLVGYLLWGPTSPLAQLLKELFSGGKRLKELEDSLTWKSLDDPEPKKDQSGT